MEWKRKKKSIASGTPRIVAYLTSPSWKQDRVLQYHLVSAGFCAAGYNSGSEIGEIRELLAVDRHARTRCKGVARSEV